MEDRDWLFVNQFLLSWIFAKSGVFANRSKIEELWDELQRSMIGEAKNPVIIETGPSYMGLNLHHIVMVGEKASKYVLEHEMGHAHLGHGRDRREWWHQLFNKRKTTALHELEATVFGLKSMEVEGTLDEVAFNEAISALKTYEEGLGITLTGDRNTPPMRATDAQWASWVEWWLDEWAADSKDYHWLVRLAFNEGRWIIEKMVRSILGCETEAGFHTEDVVVEDLVDIPGV